MADCKRKTANLFDKDAVDRTTTGYIKADGSIWSSVNFSTSGYIAISGLSSITLSGFDGGSEPAYCLYNGNKDYISGSAYTGRTTVTVTVGDAAYIRMSYRNTAADTTMLNSGSTALPYEPYWQHSLRKLGTSTDTLTTLPVDLYADGQSATVGLVGNMVQTGTPTPENPITPQETGERTGNLCDESTLLNGYYDTTYYQYYPNDNYRCFPLLLPAGTYTIFAKSDVLTIRLLRVSSASLGANVVNLDDQSYTFTLPATETIYVSLRNSTTTNDFTGLTIMLNRGSTALPYEPYGYKIPISSGGTTTPVYLGEVQSTRQIKKYEFTGEENWVGNNGDYYDDTITDYLHADYTVICTHFPTSPNVTSRSAAAANSLCMGKGSLNRIFFKWDSFVTVQDLKNYFAAQYSNGTPVTVWYVLATPTTGIVNEPLRKIGEYADSITGVTIPTLSTADTFDVDTSLKPSEVSLSYTGWHDAEVKEWDGSQWQ